MLLPHVFSIRSLPADLASVWWDQLYCLEGRQVLMRVRRKKRMSLHRGPATLTAPGQRWGKFDQWGGRAELPVSIIFTMAFNVGSLYLRELNYFRLLIE